MFGLHVRPSCNTARESDPPTVYKAKPCSEPVLVTEHMVTTSSPDLWASTDSFNSTAHSTSSFQELKRQNGCTYWLSKVKSTEAGLSSFAPGLPRRGPGHSSGGSVSKRQMNEGMSVGRRADRR